MKKITLIGATGLVGRHTLNLQLADPELDTLYTLTRKPLDIDHPKLVNQVGSFDELEQHKALFASDCLICCLGTTIKTAGSQEAFRKVDYTYVVEAARLARAQGTPAMIVVSALGAKASSGIFYNRVKGEMEEALKSLGFEQLMIVRPSLLMGDRGEKRLAEDLSKPFMKAVSPLMIGATRKYRPIEGEDVAKHIVKLCKNGAKGLQVTYPSEV